VLVGQNTAAEKGKTTVLQTDLLECYRSRLERECRLLRSAQSVASLPVGLRHIRDIEDAAQVEDSISVVAFHQRDSK
jgi:hypothetical protein